jgi:hypothetical protein
MDPTAEGITSLYYRKRIRKDIQNVSLNADMIRLLLAIDERKSIYQIAAEVELSSAALRENLSKLVQQGLVEAVLTDAPIADKMFLEAVRLNLSRVIGPMAEILIEESMADLKISPSGIQLNQAAELINHVALEIPDEKSRIRFKKSMLPILNKVKP